MMRLITNGAPTIHKHSPTLTPLGEILKDEELLQFAIASLIEEYRACDTAVIIFNKNEASDPDFQIRSGGNIVNIMVQYKGNCSVDDLDLTRIHELYRDYGQIPRLVIADAWCFESNDNGKPAISGADYCFIYETQSLLPDQLNVTHSRVLSHKELVDKYAHMWKSLDVEGVKDYFDSHLHYQSVSVFDEISSREEYLGYIKGKLKSIAKHSAYPHLTPLWDEVKQQEGLFITQGEKQLRFDITTSNGYITRIELKNCNL